MYSYFPEFALLHSCSRHRTKHVRLFFFMGSSSAGLHSIKVREHVALVHSQAKGPRPHSQNFMSDSKKKKKDLWQCWNPQQQLQKAALMHVNPNTITCDIFAFFDLYYYIFSFMFFFPFHLYSCNLSLLFWSYMKPDQKYAEAQLGTETFSSFPDLQWRLCIYSFHCSLVFAKKVLIRDLTLINICNFCLVKKQNKTKQSCDWD